MVDAQLQQVRNEITALSEELMKTDDNILAMRLEVQIHRLSRVLPVEQKKLLTIDTIIEEARLERNRRVLRSRRMAA